jgi:hypothetical protein
LTVNASMCMHMYPYLYEVKLLVNEIGQLVDDFHFNLRSSILGEWGLHIV